MTRIPFVAAPEVPLPTDVRVAVEAELADRDVLLLCVAGSHAYGMARPDSDFDVRGVYQAPAEDLLRIFPRTPDIDVDDPDLTVFEAGKFVHLALKANPNILEQLWAPPVAASDLGQLLIDNRHLFLSQRVAASYGGFAINHLRLAQRGTGGSRGRNHLKREKFLLHTLRLFEQGVSLLETGDLQIRVADPDRLRSTARQPLDKIEREIERLDARLQRALTRTSLPEIPPIEPIDELLFEIRKPALRNAG